MFLIGISANIADFHACIVFADFQNNNRICKNLFEMVITM